MAQSKKTPALEGHRLPVPSRDACSPANSAAGTAPAGSDRPAPLPVPSSLQGFSEREQRMALERLAWVKALEGDLPAPDGVPAGDRAGRRPPSPRTVAAWSRHLRDAGGDIRALVPRAGGNTQPRFPAEVEHILDQAALSFVSSPHRPTVRHICEQVARQVTQRMLDRLGEAGLAPVMPSVGTVRRRLARARRLLDTPGRGAAGTEPVRIRPISSGDEPRPVPGRGAPTLRPFDRVAIQVHQLMAHASPSSTPVRAAVAVDLATGVVTGLAAGAEPAGGLIVMALRQTLRPKAFSPAFGMPREVVLDLGRTSPWHEELLDEANQLGISLVFLPGPPAPGLRGSARCPLPVRDARVSSGLPSSGEGIRADLVAWAAAYNQTAGRDGLTPAGRWQSAVADCPPGPSPAWALADADAAWTQRRLTPGGVRVGGRFYHDAGLACLAAAGFDRVLVRADPGDPSHIAVRPLQGTCLRLVPLADRAGPSGSPEG